MRPCGHVGAGRRSTSAPAYLAQTAWSGSPAGVGGHVGGRLSLTSPPCSPRLGSLEIMLEISSQCHFVPAAAGCDVKAIEVFIRSKTQVLYLLLVARDVFSTAIKDLRLHHGPLIAFAGSLNALNQRINQLMAYGRSIVVEYLLELFIDLGQRRDEVNGTILQFTVWITLLAKSVLQYWVMVLTE